MDTLTSYSEDLYAWSQEQADVLRGMRGHPGIPNTLDLENVIEEIEDVGGSQRSAVENYLRLVLSHLIKLVSARSEEPFGHWRAEITSFQLNLATRYSRSMRRALDLDLIWRRALKQAIAELAAEDDVVVPGLPSRCPFGLDDILSDRLSVEALEAHLRASLEQKA